MGCWNETCALTVTAIRYGDPVVMVLFKNPKMQQYGVGSWEHFQRKFLEGGESIYNGLVGVFRGTYDDYGSIENFTSNKNLFPEDFTPSNNDNYIWFFTHESVWNSVVDYVLSQNDLPGRYAGYDYKQIVSVYEHRAEIASWISKEKPIYQEGQEEATKELLYILRFMWQTRRNPWIGDMYRGHQSVSLDEQRILISATQSIVDTHQKEIDAYEDDDED